MKMNNSTGDNRLLVYQEGIEKIKRGDYNIELPTHPMDDCGHLGHLLNELACVLENQKQEQLKLDTILYSLNSGLMLEDILDNIYHDFKQIIPYNRIGLALIEKEKRLVRTVWGRSDSNELKINKGYSAPLKGSSLEKIITTGQPRIINDLLGYLRSKPQSESTHLIVAEGIRSSLTCPLIIGGEPVGFIFFSSKKPNTYAHVHINIYKTIADHVSVCVERGKLVTELASSKAALESQNAELRKLNEMKNTFLGVAAHDLRSPLSQIQLATSLLLTPEPWLPEGERRKLLETFLDNIERHTRNMLDLLNELLDISQIEAGNLSLKFETVRVKEFLEEITHTHSVFASNKGAKVELENVHDDNLVADPHRLRQVMDDLISNMIKFSPSGSTITVKAYRENSHWLFSIEDGGVEIQDAARKALLKAFSSYLDDLEKGEKDAGLGMAISKQVIEAHGGSFGVDLTKGGGARFWFTLPY
jgi:signal transduction histidine kinase